MTTVLMTTDAVGGVWRYSLELADALAATSFDVALVVLGPPPSHAQRAELAASRVVTSFEVDLALEWMADPWAEVDAAGDRLLELEQSIRPDVVQLNGFAHGALPWSTPTVVVAHSDVLSWWRAVHGSPAPSSWSTYAARVGAGLRAAGAVVAPSSAMLSALHREHEFSGGTAIPNGRRRDWVCSFGRKEPLIVGVGRMWDEAKNIEALAAAAAAVDWPVALLGAGTGDDDPAQAFVGLGALPFDDVAEWLGRASIFAAPVRYEPFGLAALEAALSRCALVLGDIPSQREIWGNAAVFVDPTDAGELGAALRALTHDPDRCAELGRLAHERALHYPPDAMARSYVSVYRSLLTTAAVRR
jgi:glycogen synthase